MPEFARPKLILGDLPALEKRLASDIQAIRAGQPLAPVTILVENRMLMPYLRRQLAFYDTGHINLHIMTVAGLADRLGREPLIQAYGDTSVEPMPIYGDRVLARRIAEDTTTTYFGPVAHSPGFAETLRELFREFTQAGIRPEDWRRAAMNAQRDGTSKLREIADLYERFDRERQGFFTAQDTYYYADLRELKGDHVLVYGIWQLTGNQRRLLHRMMEYGLRLSFYLPATGTEADDAHTALRGWLSALRAETVPLAGSLNGDGSLSHLQRMIFTTPAGAAPIDGQVRLLSAPDAPREVREAARTCLRWADEGIPFHRIAVVYRQADRYRTLIDQIFRRAGIVTYLRSGRPLIEQPAGQRLMALLNLIDTDFSRAAVMEFITETILPRATREQLGDDDDPIQPARWDHITREAGIIEGREQWLNRLRLLHASMSSYIREEDEDRAIQRQRDVAEIERLRTFFEQFSADLGSVRYRGTWSEHLAFLRRVATRYIDGIDTLIDSLSMFERFDRLDREVPFERFRDFVRFWLSRQDASELLANEGQDRTGTLATEPLDPGEFGRYGVNVLDIGSLRHTCYDGIIILGVAERQFPPPPRQDPLLLDRERARINEAEGWYLPLRAQGTDDEALSFAVALQAASKRLQISYPRSEAGSTRSYLPSHFFRAAAAALTGENVEAGQVDRLPSGLYTRIPAGTFRLPPGDTPLDYHEYDRILLERDRELGIEICKGERDTVPRALDAYEARRSSQLTRYDGLIDPQIANPISLTAGLRRKPISPSRLETYATCPYQFFLRYGLGLQPVEEPETLERIGALDRGTLIHDILERFLTEIGPDDPPSVSRRSVHLVRLMEIAEDRCSELERQGLVGYRVLWEYDRIEMLEDLEEWYEHEIEDQARTALRPTTFELRFGPTWVPGQGGEGSRDEPYTLQVDDNELSFQGRVDRVDIAADRSRFRVIDYKTGKAWRNYQENSVSGGRALQLPIYLLAASELLDIPWRGSVAEYYFPTRRGDFSRVAMTGAWLESNWDEFTALLSSLSDSIESGLFMQIPELEQQRQHNCRQCDFEPVCTANVRSIAKRKRVDPRAAQFRRLIEADGPE